LRRLVIVVLALLLFGPLAARAATTEVTVNDNLTFTPAMVTVAVGDDVHWTRPGAGYPHNIVEEHGIFRNGDPQSTPFMYTRTFSAGTFRYFCEVHVGSGMIGFVKVPVTITSGPPGRLFTVRWALSGTDTGSSWDVQFRIGSGNWRAWKNDVTSLKGLFGKNDRPVHVKKGRKYSLRVRSREGSAASRWSPPESFTP
jgi:plastocyanin